ncbi:MAG: thiamine pyrophosphate-dependent enzyme, partial [candidate division KSB1 bacterium]|nr:thiamine pyrophosphate-dependent enzyme [candidate division KSB1 bacterium]
SSLDWAVAAAVEKSGPVHINIMFREPLAPKPTPFSFPTSPAFSRWQQDRNPFTVYTRPPDTGRETARQILPLLQNASHPLLIIGRRPPYHDWKAVADLITALQWPTHIDVLHPLRFAELDAPLVDERRLLAERPPIDCALHLGGPVLSKQLHTALEANPPQCFVHIDEFPRRTDPGHWVTHRFNAAPETVARALAEQLPRRSSLGKTVEWNKEWFSAELCEPAAAFWISRLLPDEHGLFLGNSMPVRDMHWFAARGRKPRPVGGNRGVSGIDGTVAAAVGFARGLAAPTTLLIGDLALLHDLNSLLLAARSPSPMTIVVVNNNGGGIFAFLPIADYAEYNDYFQTPHGLRFKKTAELFGLDYEQPQSVEAFKAAFQRALTSGRSTLIEVVSDPRENLQAHRKIEEAIRQSRGNNS